MTIRELYANAKKPANYIIHASNNHFDHFSMDISYESDLSIDRTIILFFWYRYTVDIVHVGIIL